MSKKLYYYCISPNEGLIQKEYTKIAPYSEFVFRREIGVVDKNFSIVLSEDNPEKAIRLLQTAVRKKLLPLQKMAELLKVEDKELQHKLAQTDWKTQKNKKEKNELEERFCQIVDTLETMYTMPEHENALYNFEQYLKKSYVCDFKHRRYSNVVSVEIFTTLAKTNHNDIYHAFAVYDDSSSKYPIITWHDSLEEFEAVVKQYIPEALELTEEFNKALEGVKK